MGWRNEQWSSEDRITMIVGNNGLPRRQDLSRVGNIFHEISFLTPVKIARSHICQSKKRKTGSRRIHDLKHGVENVGKSTNKVMDGKRGSAVEERARKRRMEIER